jgi:hypothetical protein
MKLVITTPTLRTPHGGTRILNEWAIHLSKYHEVSLYVQDGVLHCPWMHLPIKLTKRTSVARAADLVIIGSPHSVGLIKHCKRHLAFMQMVEHLFNDNKQFKAQCDQFYNTPGLLLSYSKWNMEYLEEIGRQGETKYISTGINLRDFPLEQTKKSDIVLVEGWECTNLAKDVDNLGPRVAEKLREKGYYVVAYSQKPLKTLKNVPHEYYQCPNLAKMNSLYSRAKVLVKATRYDARAVAPLEAMTKGTVTSRAIIKGDDDLIDGVTCLRTDYNFKNLYENTLELLTNQEKYDIISYNCLNYVQNMDWRLKIEEINTIICDYVAST